MDAILSGYGLNSATWFYLSLLLTLAVYFRFNRFWSIRNLDLVLLLSLSPGLLLVEVRPALGYAWLFGATGVLLVRLFCDGLFPRRPRLEPNMNPAGLAFLCAVSFGFLTVNVLTRPVPPSIIDTVRRGDQLLNRIDRSASQPPAAAGPASSLLAAPVVPISSVVAAGQGGAAVQDRHVEVIAGRMMAILAHAAVIVGLWLIGRLHFGDPHTGLAMATLYLLLPCTAYRVGEVNHVLPAALILWALVAYRKPLVSGTLLGLACGTLFFPIYLLPLWAAFYGRRGGLRFGLALGVVGAVLLLSLALVSKDPASFLRQAVGLIDWSAISFQGDAGSGFWTPRTAPYRLPVLVGFLLMTVGLTVWPRQKNLEHLLAYSTAIIVGTQFWYPQQGGVYLLWYLPLLLLVIFRPRLAHLVPPQLSRPRAEVPAAEEPPRRELVGSAAGSRHFLR